MSTRPLRLRVPAAWAGPALALACLLLAAGTACGPGHSLRSPRRRQLLDGAERDERWLRGIRFPARPRGRGFLWLAARMDRPAARGPLHVQGCRARRRGDRLEARARLPGGAGAGPVVAGTTTLRGRRRGAGVAPEGERAARSSAAPPRKSTLPTASRGTMPESWAPSASGSARSCWTGATPTACWTSTATPATRSRSGIVRSPSVPALRSRLRVLPAAAVGAALLGSACGGSSSNPSSPSPTPDNAFRITIGAGGSVSPVGTGGAARDPGAVREQPLAAARDDVRSAPGAHRLHRHQLRGTAAARRES